ncbi:MAG: hypothetical protein P4K86_10805 [Terracidiphilus sp.]|nr:hypothetical protein [Terracidiphilus sp.]MDR3776112.1 hypothetical protein [Terracidiphilus sp.]
MVHPISAAIQRAANTLMLPRNIKRTGLMMLLFLLLALFSATAQESVSVAPQTPGVSAAQQTGEVEKAQSQQHSSDVLSYWYGANYRTPFVFVPNSGKAADIARNSVEYTHVGSVGMLSNFADVTVGMSDMAEPSASGGMGATEVYVILREGIGLNELTHSSAFKKGPLRNVAMEVGANLETKNSSFAPAERTLYMGPKFVFAMPKGFFNVGLHFRKEWNHEGVLGKAENYTPDFNIEPNWMVPFKIGEARLAFSGFAEYNSPKGKDSFGSDSISEYLIRSVVAVDMGSVLMHRPQLLDLNGGLWYWRNEYGKPASDPGAKQLTPLVGITLHLGGGQVHHNR